MKSILLGAGVALGLAGLMAPALGADARPLVTTQPDPQADVAPWFVPDGDPRWSSPDWSADDIAALRQKIKYVFVIFNENRSFDHAYGTLPGVDGLYSDGRKPRSAADTAGFTQSYEDTVTGRTVTVQPFLIGPAENASFRDSTDHSHKGLAAKLDVQDGVPRMDRFAEVEWRRHARSGSEKGEAMGTQFARLVMAHIDCDTIPFFWRWATRFTIFDNNFATEDSPSTPNAVAILAGQAGETQWVKHRGGTDDPAGAGFTGTVGGTINGKTYSGTATTQGPPLVNNPQPWWGSAFDTTALGRQPTAPRERWDPSNTASNLTFASLPLTMMGGWINLFIQWDHDPAFDLPDVTKDVAAIAASGKPPVNWRWHQNGYDLEPSDDGLVVSHSAYVSHHNGAQYFGYIANNPVEAINLRGEGDFFTDLRNGGLPPEGGVFYIRGGYVNLDYPKRTAVIQNPNYPNPNGLTSDERERIARTKSGDDDHPGYSDSMLSEAMNARVINAVASNERLWAQSAIVIAYDESDGLYDHVPPRFLSYGPDGLPLARGVRVPLLLISPYARAHAVSHAEGDHNAIIETINALFDLPPLSSLPDEQEALTQGSSPRFNAVAPRGFEQKFLGPRDTPSPETDSLLSGFDQARVTGALPPLPASLAVIPREVVETFPHYGGKGCEAIGVTPENVRQKIPNLIPEGFNALPATLPDYN